MSNTPTPAVEVTQADRDLWKFILDAPFATCSRIDNLPDECPELQEIARHRLTSLPTRDAAIEEAAKVAEGHAAEWGNRWQVDEDAGRAHDYQFGRLAGYSDGAATVAKAIRALSTPTSGEASAPPPLSEGETR